MTKKLIVGAAAAALPALVLAAGAAGAQAASTDTGVATTSDVLVNEIGVAVVDAGPSNSIDGTFIELGNAGSSAVDVGGYVLSGCDATNSRQTIAVLPDGIILDPGELYLLADDDFFGGIGSDPDQEFAAGAPDLVQSDGGLLLQNSVGTPAHDVKWGNPQSCAVFVDAGVTPDGDHSIQPNPTPPPAWCRTVPTPGGSNGPCVI